MGLISALGAYPQKNLLVVAVDMPGLQVGALTPLIKKPYNNNTLGRCYAKTALGQGQGGLNFFPFPLFLGPASLEPIKRAFLAGERALMPVLAALSLEHLTVSPEISSTLFNVNTPQALADFHDSMSP